MSYWRGTDEGKNLKNGTMYGKRKSWEEQTASRGGRMIAPTCWWQGPPGATA